jgi:hypothetical protein
MFTPSVVWLFILMDIVMVARSCIRDAREPPKKWDGGLLGKPTGLPRADHRPGAAMNGRSGTRVGSVAYGTSCESVLTLVSLAICFSSLIPLPDIAGGPTTQLLENSRLTEQHLMRRLLEVIS